jgi:hypothetical protein
MLLAMTGIFLGVILWWLVGLALVKVLDIPSGLARGHPRVSLVVVLMILSWVILIPTVTYLVLWLAGLCLARRGIIRPDEIRGCVFRSQYPLHWYREEVESNEKPPIRNWKDALRFKARTLMVIIGVLALGLGMHVHSSRVQQDAVAEIERRGGKVWQDWEYKNYSVAGKGKPRRFKWLEDWVGVDYLGTALLVILDSPGETDAALVHIGRLPQLQALKLSSTSATDFGLTNLDRIKDLDALYLDGTRITDAGLAHIVNLPRLRSLGLRKTHVTDQGMTHLVGMSNLVWLDLTGTEVGDAGLAHLSGLAQLDTLGLGQTRVTDAGLGHLKGLKKLYSLDLTKANVSDTGLKQLKGLTRLRDLGLEGTGVTDAGVDDLRQALPNLRIRR